MSTWVWVVIGAVAYVLLSAWVALGLAAVLGRISRSSERLESEAWTSSPNVRERAEAAVVLKPSASSGPRTKTQTKSITSSNS